MKSSLIILLWLTSLNTFGQEKTEFDAQKWLPTYDLATPKDWGIERFPIPINFAPEIPYEGVEDIRFTQGWANSTTNEYWTYAFLWCLEGKEKMNSKIIRNNLKYYYTGLVGSMQRDSLANKTNIVKTEVKKVKTQKGDLKTFNASIEMIDYMTNKPITLNCKVHIKSCLGQNKTFVFYEISPKSFTDNVWKSLDDLWTGFSCEKSVEIK
ncbi:MAG: hypothetical protein ACK476_15195 [Fluviicola sp.]